MQEILNGLLFSILAGGAVFIAVSIQQLDSVQFVWSMLFSCHSSFHLVCFPSTGTEASWCVFLLWLINCDSFHERLIPILLFINICFRKSKFDKQIYLQHQLVWTSRQASTLYPIIIAFIAANARAFGLWNFQLFSGNLQKGVAKDYIQFTK